MAIEKNVNLCYYKLERKRGYPNVKKKLGILFLVIIAIILIAGLIYKNVTRKEETQKYNFKIVTTFYPVYIMTQNISQGAQNVELVNMSDTNVGCLHNYTLSTTDMKKIENSDVIIQNGLGLENFIDKILNTYSNIKVIDSSKNITNKIEENGEINSHTWTSISNYILQVEEIANQLIDINSENASVYKENRDNYIKKLEELQLMYNNELTKLNGKKVICLNEALTYLAREIGLDVISIETDHEESSLSAEKMKILINQVKQENIKTILVDSGDNLKSAETLANETEAKIYKLKSGLTGDMSLNAYIETMEENLEILKNIE